MDRPIRVVVADDHAFLRQGLADYLKEREFEVVGQAVDGTEALQLITDLQPDVAILDIEMPYLSGFSVAEMCHRNGYKTRIVILSLHKELDFISRAKQLKIAGYMLKEDATSELVHCIEEILKGGTYFSKALMKEADGNDADGLGLTRLSPSERKILRLVAEKKTSEEIADILFISSRTVEKHRSNIVAKLNLSGQSNSLTNWAIEHKQLVNALN
jgi:DNA-binding NarL/FixJ family response regulator